MIIQGEREKKAHIHYEFDKTLTPIGVGGMGVVYQGVMVDELTGVTRDVAIKEIQTDTDGPQRLALIEQAEREASIRLKNDNLVEMIDFVRIEETRFNSVKTKYYVISELLHGVSLDRLLRGEYTDFQGNTVLYAQEIGKRYKLDNEDTAALIIRNILSGVMALHDKGYLHRDLDPSNVMVTDEGKIKIIDFGIAKKHNRLSSEDGLQKEGVFVGKVEYAAPELINGNVSEQDFSTDIYSIGVLFYKLITGRLPYEGNRFEIVKGHQHGRPDLSSIKSAKYKAVIAKALQKQTKRRYQSAAEMRVALDGADPLPRWGMAVMGGAGVLVVVVAAVLLWPKPSPKPVSSDGKISGLVDIPDPVRVPPDGSDTLRVNELIALPMPLDRLKEQGNNPAILYASADFAFERKNNAPDSVMMAFWQEVLVPEGDVDKCLVNDKEYSRSRFVFVSACRALRFLDSFKYAPGSKEKLGNRINGLIEIVKKRDTNNNFKLPNTE